MARHGKRPVGLTNLHMANSLEAENTFSLSETGTFQKGGFAINSRGISRAPMRNSDFSSLTLEQLEPLETLGTGASGTVRLARDRNSGHLLALKIINVMSDQAQRHQVLNELKVLCSIEHPQLVPLFDAFYLEGHVYLALGFMNGGSLLQLMDSYKAHTVGSTDLPGLPENVLAHVLLQVLLGLDHLHSKGVVHRDLKPANILIDTGGAVRVSDFGISKQLEQTFAVSFVGTAAYMAPERINGNDYSMASDVWAVGMIGIECAQGQHPYSNVASYYDLVVALSEGERPPRLRPELFSHPLCDFVACALTTRPTERPLAGELLRHDYIGLHHDYLDVRHPLDEEATQQLASLAALKFSEWIQHAFSEDMKAAAMGSPLDGEENLQDDETQMLHTNYEGDPLILDVEASAVHIQAALRGMQVRRDLEEMRLLEEQLRQSTMMTD